FAPAVAQTGFKEGTDYFKLNQAVPTETAKGRIEVLEFFWYNCPHCNAFEPTLSAWGKKLPKDVELKRVPVRFRAEFEPQQRAYYVLEALGKVEELQGKMFAAIHTERQTLTTLEPLLVWAEKNGIPKKQFTDLYNSFTVIGKARRAAQLQEQFKVEGVPALGVAGRFYVDGSLAGSMERALQVVDFLLGEVRKGR
ncbi:MAG: thiol:disulfide interchange protein DsbA/DsbL, partial [Betaproteobacteria bacterium]|nr:thiol:disulfide interchange protein DsbA/DsbL [Betaproteobacteria bacterium]